MMEQDQYYSISKAAEVFEVEPVFLLKSIKSGKLKAHRRSGRYLINWYDLVDYKRTDAKAFNAASTAEEDDIFAGGHS